MSVPDRFKPAIDALERRIGGAGALHDEIARSHPSLLRGRVWCVKCGAFKAVDAATCLRSGWPKCHGATMTIDSPEKSSRTAPLNR